MAKYRTNLPQLNGDKFLTDGGLETTLIFHEGLELPEFAAFDLLKNDDGRKQLYKYYSTYAAIARGHKVGLSSKALHGGPAQNGGKNLAIQKKPWWI